MRGMLTCKHVSTPHGLKVAIMAIGNPKPKAQKPASSKKQPYQPKSRVGKKAVVGYFTTKVTQQISILAATENKSIQALLGEAIDLLFEKRGLPAANER